MRRLGHIVSIAGMIFLLLGNGAVWGQNAPAPAGPVPGPAQGQAALSDSAAPPPAPQAEAKSPFADPNSKGRHPINMTLDNMDIYVVLDQVLGQILGMNYVVDPAIKGTISVSIKGKYTRNELINLFNSILQLQGVAITKGPYDLYQVVRKGSTGGAEGDVVAPGQFPTHPGDVIQVFQLEYLSAPYVATNLKSFVSPGALVVAEPTMNAVFVADSAENLKKVAKLINLMDTDLFKDIHWRLYPLKNTSVDDISKDLDSIFQKKGLYLRPGLDEGGIQVIPLQTLNSLLVVTRWEELLNVVDHWVTELDQTQSEQGVQVHVYFVQHGQAEDIADILRQVYGGESTKSKTTGGKMVLVRREQTAPSAAAPAARGKLVGDVEIIPDTVNNALIIKASAKDYSVMSKVLEQIDVLPRQVLIDVLILEVSLQHGVQYGVEWFLKNKGVKINGDSHPNYFTLTDLNLGGLAQDTPLGSGVSGLAYSLYNKQGDLRALVQLLAENTQLNILSSPNILALDNQESTIESGQEVPTLSATQTTDGGVTTQSVNYRETGVILKVKPSINDSGQVRMEVTQEVSAVDTQTTGGINSPTFQTRKATTNLVAQDGQTVVIGGLMQTQRKKTHTGIPLLKDIPVLGYLFGSKGVQTDKTELLIAITPRVIRSKEQADALAKEFSDRLKSIKDMLGHEPLENR